MDVNINVACQQLQYLSLKCKPRCGSQGREMPLSPCGAGPLRWGAPSARPAARAVPVGKEAVPWRRRRRARSGPGPRRSPCSGRRPARPAALTVSRPGGHLPSVPVLGSRCAPGAVVCGSFCEGLALEARLLRRSSETVLQVFPVLSYPRVCPQVPRFCL